MNLKRRTLLTAALAMGVGVSSRGRAQSGGGMYGLIGKMSALSGKRDELIAVLVGSTGAMPGCLGYVVAKDTIDGDAIWITEVWDSKASHDASLSLPEVKAAISKGRPLIASFDPPVVTTPVGGYNLKGA